MCSITYCKARHLGYGGGEPWEASNIDRMHSVIFAMSAARSRSGSPQGRGGASGAGSGAGAGSSHGDGGGGASGGGASSGASWDLGGGGAVGVRRAVAGPGADPGSDVTPPVWYVSLAGAAARASGKPQRCHVVAIAVLVSTGACGVAHWCWVLARCAAPLGACLSPLDCSSVLVVCLWQEATHGRPRACAPAHVVAAGFKCPLRRRLHQPSNGPRGVGRSPSSGPMTPKCNA